MNRVLLLANSPDALIELQRALEERGQLGFTNFTRNYHYTVYNMENCEFILVCRPNVICLTSLIVEEVIHMFSPHLVIDFGSAADIKEEHVGEIVVSESVLSADMCVGPGGENFHSFIFMVKKRIQSSGNVWQTIFPNFPYMSYDGELFKRTLIISSDGVEGDNFVEILDKKGLKDGAAVDAGSFGVGSACDFFSVPFVFFKYLVSLDIYKNLLVSQKVTEDPSLIKFSVNKLFGSLLGGKK